MYLCKNYRTNRMKKSIFFILLLLICKSLFAQNTFIDFKTIIVNKKIQEFPDKFDLSSALSATVTLKYLQANGKNGLEGKLCVKRNRVYWPETNSPDTKLSIEKKNKILNLTIKEVLIYKDSIAFSIIEEKESYYKFRWYEINDGQWLAGSEDARHSIEELHKYFISNAENHMQTLKQAKIISAIPSDSLAFINYLNKHGEEPMQFILNALKKHELVIYGEIHNRPSSWELCRDVIRDTNFVKITGTVFLELSSHKQPQIDQFLGSKTLNTDLILDVFHETFDLDFWSGMFDFFIDIWNINQSLPDDKKVKIVAADIPRPFSTFKSEDDIRNHFQRFDDRDKYMAETIENYLRTKKDIRNSLFIVGAGHVYKSTESAGGLLVKDLTPEKVYTIFTHCPITTNDGIIPGRIRNGVFDYAFYKIGNKRVAFQLNGSPFGKEPFDAFPEISYSSKTGNFSNNYDGYIFLGSLDDEITDRILFEAYTIDFILELKRRCDLNKISFEELYGVSEPTRAAFISTLIKDKDPYRWKTRLQALSNY